jgi:hypothetical protein
MRLDRILPRNGKVTMMRWLFPLVAFALSTPAAPAGVSYDFRSVSTGTAGGVVAGHVDADGAAFRLTLTEGSGPLLKSGLIVVSRDGRILDVLDPKAASFYELDIKALTGSFTALFGAGGVARVAILNPRNTSRDAGPGGVVSGYPTRRIVSMFDGDVAIESMGQKVKAHVHSDSQRWTTDRVDPKYIGVLQLQGVKSGIPDIDRILEADTSSQRGFPLRQVSTLLISSQATGSLSSSTTTTVTALTEKSQAASLFSVPPNYRKVRSPMQGMLSGGN